jgi:hypothetical protein
VRFVIGHRLNVDIANVVVKVPEAAWQPAISANGTEPPERHGPMGGEQGDLDRLRVLKDEDEEEHEYERGDDDGDPSG